MYLHLDLNYNDTNYLKKKFRKLGHSKNTELPYHFGYPPWWGPKHKQQISLVAASLFRLPTRHLRFLISAFRPNSTLLGTKPASTSFESALPGPESMLIGPKCFVKPKSTVSWPKFAFSLSQTSNQPYSPLNYMDTGCTGIHENFS